MANSGQITVKVKVDFEDAIEALERITDTLREMSNARDN